MFEFFPKIFRLGYLSAVKGFDVFSVIRLKGKVDFLTRKFLGVFLFHRALVIVAKCFEKGFLSSFISKYMFSVVAN